MGTLSIYGPSVLLEHRRYRNHSDKDKVRKKREDPIINFLIVGKLQSNQGKNIKLEGEGEIR